MLCGRSRASLDIIIHSLDGDGTILCCVVVARGRASIVVNSRYPDALEHAQRHLMQTDTCIWLCSPDCPG